MKTFIIAVIIVAALLAFTNPDREAFRKHTERVVANELVNGTQSIPGGDILGRVGGVIAAEVAADVFVRNNYFFFSTYEMNLDAPGFRSGTWRFLGVGTMFFELDRPSIR